MDFHMNSIIELYLYELVYIIRELVYIIGVHRIKVY